MGVNSGYVAQRVIPCNMLLLLVGDIVKAAGVFICHDT